jgi:hypothetical protein
MDENRRLSNKDLTTEPLVDRADLARTFSAIEPKGAIGPREIQRVWNALCLKLSIEAVNPDLCPPLVRDALAFSQAFEPDFAGSIERLLPLALKLGKVGILARLPESFDMTKEANAAFLNVPHLERKERSAFLAVELPLLQMGVYHPTRYLRLTMKSEGRFASIKELQKAQGQQNEQKNKMESAFLNFLLGHDVLNLESELGSLGIYWQGVKPTDSLNSTVSEVIERVGQMHDQLSFSMLCQAEAIDSKLLSKSQLSVAHFQRAQTRFDLALLALSREHLKRALDNHELDPNAPIPDPIDLQSLTRKRFEQDDLSRAILDDLLGAKLMHPCPEQVFDLAFRVLRFLPLSAALTWAERLLDQSFDSHSGEPLLQLTWTRYGGSGTPPKFNGSLAALIQVAFLQRYDEMLENRVHESLYDGRPPLWAMPLVYGNDELETLRRNGVPDRILIFPQLGWESRLWPYFKTMIDRTSPYRQIMRMKLLHATLASPTEPALLAESIEELTALGLLVTQRPATEERLNLWSQNAPTPYLKEFQGYLEAITLRTIRQLCQLREWELASQGIKAIRRAWGEKSNNPARSNELATTELALELDPASPGAAEPLADLRDLAKNRRWTSQEFAGARSLYLAIRIARRVDSAQREDALTYARAAGLDLAAAKALTVRLRPRAIGSDLDFEGLVRTLEQAATNPR